MGCATRMSVVRGAKPTDWTISRAMARKTVNSARDNAVWELVRRQYGAISRAQLLGLGFSPEAIDHRRERGRLHAVHAGVYAVGRPELSRLGEMLAATLACGEDSRISHATSGELWGMRKRQPGPIHVSVPAGRRPRRNGIVIHQRSPSILSGSAERAGIPVTSVPLTLIDLAAALSPEHLERAVNMADSLDLLQPDRVRAALDEFPPMPGIAALRRLLDDDAFVLTDSVLEQRFARVASKASLPRPVTQRYLGTHRCDFVWPTLGLVAETDGLRYHRTRAQQRRDAARDHAHLLAGRESVRFTHFQIAYDQRHVVRTLEAAARKAKALRGAVAG